MSRIGLPRKEKHTEHNFFFFDELMNIDII